MNFLSTLKYKCRPAALKQSGLTLVIEHSPCCLLAFVAGFIGISFLYHNPVLELGFAMGGAVIGKRIGQKYFQTQCCDDTRPLPYIGLTVKDCGFAFVFGGISWALHQILVHGEITLHMLPHAHG